MHHLTRTTTAAVVTAALALAGCSGDDDGGVTASDGAVSDATTDADDDGDTDEDADTTADGADDPDATTEGAGDGAGDDAGGAADGDAAGADGDGADADGDGAGDGDAAPGGTVEVDATVDHPSAVQVTVTGVEVDGRAVYVDLEAFNGSDRDVVLAYEGDATFVGLEDDTGRTYPWQPPEADAELPMPSGAELSARLGFLGEVPTDATALTLRLNYNTVSTVAIDGPFPAETVTPTFVVEDLPIPTG